MHRNILKGILSQSSGVVTPLLDLYPNASTAFSIRLLRTAYAGKCMKVRRDSDDAELDIGFVNGYIDTTSLLAFTGAGNGYIRIWYDQSGLANNAEQATTTLQPQVVAVGLFIIPQFSDTSAVAIQQFMSFSTPYLVNEAAVSVFSALDIQTLIGSMFIHGNDGIADRNIEQYAFLTGGRYYPKTRVRRLISGEKGVTSPIELSTGKYIISSFCNRTNVGILVNSTYTEAADANENFNYSNINYIGNKAAASSTGVQRIYEQVIYNSDKISDKLLIEANINSYHSIF